MKGRGPEAIDEQINFSSSSLQNTIKTPVIDNEIDVTVTRVGSLAVRLRYHRLLLTPYISAWEDSNKPLPGPLLEAVKALEEPTFIPEIGDALVAVNGQSILGLPLEGAVEIIRASAVLGTARVLRFRRTTEFERDHVDGKQSVLEGTSSEPWVAGMSRLDAFNRALGGSDGMVDDTTLRSLSAGGCPEETGARGMVWRYLLDQLPPNRRDWATHLERERSLYLSFSSDMFQRQSHHNLQAAASSLANEQMYEDPRSEEKDGDNGTLENKSETSIPTNHEVNEAEESTSDKVLKPAQDRDESDGGKRDPVEEDEFLLYEISKDVVRTHPDLQFFLDAKHGPARYESIKRVLFVYAKLNPGVKYVQGMNELLGALFYVLAAQSPQPSESPELAQLFGPEVAEADSFNCFTVLMGELRDVFVEDLDDSTTGIKGRMLAIDSLLSYHDPELHRVLTELGVDPTFYTLRWITTLLSREFDLPDTLRLWDAFLAERGMRNREIWLAYFCVAMIVGIRGDLLETDFGGAINLLQAYPPSAPSIENLLDTAGTLRLRDETGISSNTRSITWPWTGRSTLSESMSSERWSAAARPLMTDLRAKASQSAAALAAKAGGSASVMADSVGAARSWWSRKSNLSMDSSTSPAYSATGSEPAIEALTLQEEDIETTVSNEVPDKDDKGPEKSLISSIDLPRTASESDDEFEDIPLPSRTTLERWS